MLNFLLQAAAANNNFPFKSMLAKVFTSINKNLDICKVNNDAGGIIEIFGTWMTAVFYIVMLLWIAFIIFNIFGSNKGADKDDNTPPSTWTNDDDSFTSFWSKVKSNAAKQLLPWAIWFLILIAGIATMSC